MKKNLFIITFFLGAFSLSAQTQKQEKTITVEVQNNWNQPKADAPVVINLHELHAGFKVKSAVVMEGRKEIPSQLDDLNRDRKMDELVFVADLPAHGRKTFQVTLSSEKSTKTYPERVYADMFIVDNKKGKHQRVQAITVPGTSNIYSMVRPHGPVLESELVGYRLYFNEKQTPTPETKVPAVGATTTVKGVKYAVTKSAAKGGTAQAVKVTGKGKKITIAATVKIDGVTFKVTSIKKNAAKKNKNMTSVVIGKNVTSIGANSFANSKKLANVTFKGTKAVKVGSKAFKGTSAKMKVVIPKKMSKKTLNTLKRNLKKAGISKKTVYKKK